MNTPYYTITDPSAAPGLPDLADATVAPSEDHRTLSTPISREDLDDIRVGDVILLDGHIVTCRDVGHRRLVEFDRELPVDLRGGAILHAGPIIRTIPGADGAPDRYEVAAVGPTTSMRMEMFEEEFIRRTGVRLIVGKGGMGPQTVAGCRDFGALHCVFPAGNAVVAATEVEQVEARHWPELGMPESLWVLRVRRFGPLIVSIDAHGHNLFEEKGKEYNRRKEAVLPGLYEKVRYIR